MRPARNAPGSEPAADRLSARARAHVAALFRPGEVTLAEHLVAIGCDSNLPLVKGADDLLERIRFAAIKQSSGDLVALRRAIALARTDWRDLLVDAGFADDIHAHEQWDPRR